MNPTDLTAALVADRRDTYLAEAAARRLATLARHPQRPPLVAAVRLLAAGILARWSATPAGRRPAACACNA